MKTNFSFIPKNVFLNVLKESSVLRVPISRQNLFFMCSKSVDDYRSRNGSKFNILLDYLLSSSSNENTNKIKQ